MSFFDAVRRICRAIPPAPVWGRFSAVLALSVFCSLFGALPQVHAQAIITTVNGDPITDLDVSQRIKLLHALREPATRDAALNSLIDDQLMLQETGLYKVKATDAEIGQQIMRTASEKKVAPQVLLTQIQQAGVSESHYKEYFAAIITFDSLIQAFHKGVEPSETQIHAELAKQGGKAAGVAEYKIRQVIFVIPTAAGLAGIRGRVEAAQQLRVRFSDCASGLQLARGMDNVAVKEEITRSSADMSTPLKKLLEKTPVGHLTAPQRTEDGIEMIAVCSKGASTDQSAVLAAISARLLNAQIKTAAAERLKELRANAIIVKK